MIVKIEDCHHSTTISLKIIPEVAVERIVLNELSKRKFIKKSNFNCGSITNIELIFAGEENEDRLCDPSKNE